METTHPLGHFPSCWTISCLDLGWMKWRPSRDDDKITQADQTFRIPGEIAQWRAGGEANAVKAQRTSWSNSGDRLDDYAAWSPSFIIPASAEDEERPFLFDCGRSDLFCSSLSVPEQRQREWFFLFVLFAVSSLWVEVEGAGVPQESGNGVYLRFDSFQVSIGSGSLLFPLSAAPLASPPLLPCFHPASIPLGLLGRMHHRTRALSIPACHSACPRRANGLFAHAHFTTPSPLPPFCPLPSCSVPPCPPFIPSFSLHKSSSVHRKQLTSCFFFFFFFFFHY